jgi:signal transduction histidine kinase
MARDEKSEDWERVAVRDIIEDSLSLIRERFRAAGISLEVAEAPSDLYFFGNRTSIAQVLLNLLNNAWDAVRAQRDLSPAGGSVPLLERTQVQIEVDSSDSRWIRVKVRDQGLPVTSEVVERLFQPFFTTKPPGQGTGIGLPLSKRIIEAHGGKLYFAQNAGKKEFIFELPRVPL